MTIEETFKIIRKFLNDGIKHYEDTIKELEEMIKDDDELINPVNVSPKTLLSKFKYQEDVDKFLQSRESTKKILFDSKKHLKTIRQNREFFGKSHILKKVVDFEAFFANLNYMNYVLEFPFDREIIAKIIGMAIYTNNEIYDRNKKELENDLNSKHSFLRKESHLVRELKPYFNKDGEVITNSDISEFLFDLTMLFSINHDRIIEQKIPLDKQFSVSELIGLLTNNIIETNKNQVIVEEQKKVIDTIITKKERRQLVEQQRLNEQELATYFDGGKILRACDSLEDFVLFINSCNLNAENKTRIINKMQTFLNKNDDLRKISFLSQEEQKIYKLSLNKKLGNSQVKELIDEIDLLLDMNNESLSKEDKECVENEVKALIERLKFKITFNSLSLQNK